MLLRFNCISVNNLKFDYEIIYESISLFYIFQNILFLKKIQYRISLYTGGGRLDDASDEVLKYLDDWMAF